MVNLTHIGAQQPQSNSLNLPENIRQLVQMVIMIRNLPMPLLSNAIHVTLPGIDRCFDFINLQLTRLAGSLHNPPRFDDILDVAAADLEIGKHQHLLSRLYSVHSDTTCQNTPEALGELFRTLLSGFVAEPRAINAQFCASLANALQPCRKPDIPENVWQWRIEQYLVHRYLLYFPEKQRFINLPVLLNLARSYLPLPPLLQQLLTGDPLTFLYSIFTMNHEVATAPTRTSLALWNQTLFEDWNQRLPASFLAGSTAHTLNTPAQCLPGVELPPHHSYSFFRLLHNDEVPQCLTNQTQTYLPYGTQVRTFTGRDSSGNMHLINRVQVGSAALRVRDIYTVETSQLLHLIRSDAIGDGVSEIVPTPGTDNAQALRHSTDTRVNTFTSTSVNRWQSVVDLLDINFPPLVQADELKQLHAQHHGRIFVSPRPVPVLNPGIPLVEVFLARIQRDLGLIPPAENRRVTLLFRYPDGVPGEKRLPLKTVLTTFRGNEYAVIYPKNWYQHFPQAIAQFDAYRGYNRTTADPLRIRLQNADFQRLKRLDLWPARWEVHAMDFILALTEAFKFDENVLVDVLFYDGDSWQAMTLAKVITTPPDIIQIIKWPPTIPVAASHFLDQFRKTTSPVLRKNLLLEIALNNPAVQQGFQPYSLNEMIEELRPLTQSDSLADLDIRVMASTWVNEQLNEHYDAFEQTSGLAIPQSKRLKSASRVMARVYYHSGADGTETLVKSQRVSLENLAFNELQTQYGINHRIEVDVPPALRKAWSPEDPLYLPTFPITEAIYQKMSGNIDRCQKSSACYDAIAEMQRRLVNYRLACYLNVLNDRNPKNASDHIERKQLTDLLKCADSRPVIHLIKFDGQLLATCFAIRGAGRWLLFSTEYEGVITLHENKQTLLTAEEQTVLFWALPLKYSLLHANDKARLNIILATGTDREGRLGRYDFVVPATSDLHLHLTETLFEHNIADVETLFRLSTETWSDFARSFPGDTFTGMTALLDQFALKSLSSVARSLTAVSKLVSNAPEIGVAFMLAKLAAEKNPPLALDILIGTGFNFTGLATRSPDLLPGIRNLVGRGNALKSFIAGMLAKKQTPKILSALERGKLQAVLPATQLNIPFANPLLKIRYSNYNHYPLLRADLLPQILAGGRRYARELLKSASKTLALAEKRPLIKRLLQLFFARHDDAFIQQFAKQLRQMRRDLNQFNVREHLYLSADEETTMAVDLVNYKRFVKNYVALENGEAGVARFSDTVATINSDNLLYELNSCGESIVACAALQLIALFTQGVAMTLNYAQAAEVKKHKGVRDFAALCNLNDANFIPPARFQGPDARFLAENRRSYVQGLTTGSRNTDSYRWVIYFLASMAENSLAEEGITKLERSRFIPPER